MKFKPIDHQKFDNCYKKFKDDWALLSAGKIDCHNAMTVAWGGLGYLWKKEVAYIFVRPSRHTFNFTEKNEYFALLKPFLHFSQVSFPTIKLTILFPKVRPSKNATKLPKSIPAKLNKVASKGP